MLDEKKMRLLETRIEGWRIRVKDTDQRKTYDEVFDQRTLLTIFKMINDGLFTKIDYPVSTGKEGNVFHGMREEKAVALKIYRVSNATFNTISSYLRGDSRYRGLRGDHRRMICAWATKEFKNLDRLAAAGTRVPQPLAVSDNILVMGYLGDDTTPAPMLKNLKIEDPNACLDDVVENMKCIQKAGMVHGDLSEYNILLWDGRTYIIDVGQAVTLDHPQAEEWFTRDIDNMARYFRHQGLKLTPKQLRDRVRGE